MKITNPILVLASSILSTVMMASVAHAVVPQPGQFVASECGTAIEAAGSASSPAALIEVEMSKSVAVSKVCIGLLSLTPTDAGVLAMSFELTDGQVQAFRVVQTSDSFELLLSGLSKSTFFIGSDDGGQVFPVQILRTRDQKIISAQGKLAEITYKTAEFQPIVILE